jgi:hypothetical protein
LVKEDRKYPQAAAMEKEFLERVIFDTGDSKQRSKAINAAGTAVGELVNVQRGIVNQLGSQMMSSEYCSSERV